MKTSRAKKIKEIKAKAKKIQSEITKMPEAQAPFKIEIKNNEALSSRKHDKKKDTRAHGGKFSLDILITATKNDIYIPLSMGSGRVSKGFVYHTEGAKVTKSVTNIKYEGKGSSLVTFGSIEYCKIPAGKSVLFKLLFKINGEKDKKYKIVINRISYKLNINDFRYKRLHTSIVTKAVKFR